jgi:diguanylate cyclase (GGDEF)-like protein
MSQYSIPERINLLQKMELFSKLSYEELEIVAFNSQMVNYKHGSLIFIEESQSNEMYVIKSGEVLITKHRENDVMDIARFVAGESFGEWDLIGNTLHNATAVALVDTELLIFPKEGIDLTMVLHNYPRMSAQILNKLLGIIAKRIRNTNRLINEKTPWIRNLKKQMVVDKLTGLYNKNFLLTDFDEMLSHEELPTGLLIIKPDNFKEINDRYGHYAGDRMLILLAIFIQSALREFDIAVRYEGDEFAAILPGASRDEAIRIAKELGTSIYDMDTSRITGDPRMKITVSIGVALFPANGNNARTLIQKAYEKMLKALHSGGKRIIVMH